VNSLKESNANLSMASAVQDSQNLDRSGTMYVTILITFLCYS